MSVSIRPSMKSLVTDDCVASVRVSGESQRLGAMPFTRTLATQSSVTSDFIDGRMLTDTLLLPRDLVGTAVFLASEASGRVSGHIVAVDDGYLAA